MQPPRVAEWIVATLTPPACREHVLGDLQERCTSTRQYVRDALTTVPGVIFSQIRRTGDPQLFVIQAFLVLLSFFAASWSLEGVRWIAKQDVLRFGIPAVTIVVAFVLAQVYAAPGRSATRHVWLRAAFAVSIGFLSQAALLVAAPALTLPRWTMILGGATSVLLLGALQLVFPPRHVTLQLAGRGPEQAVQSADISERWEQFQKTARRSTASLLVSVVCVAWLGIWSCMARSMVDRVFGGAMVAIALNLVFQVLRRHSSGGVTGSQELLRKQLEGRRDALRSMWAWFIGPYLCALILFPARLAVVDPERWYNALPFTIMSVVWAIGTGKQSASEARKLQREIDRL